VTALAPKRLIEARRGRPTKDQAQAIPKRIIATATRLFLRDGFEKTSMDMIASEAQVSKRTLYAHHPGKAELFADVVVAFHQGRLDELECMPLAGGSLRDQLRGLADGTLSIMIQPDVIALERVIAGEAHQFPQLAARVYREVGLRALAMVAAVLSGFPPYRDRPPEELELDAQIFLALVLLPPLRRAMLDGPRDCGFDGALLQRSIEIFIAGSSRQ